MDQAAIGILAAQSVAILAPYLARAADQVTPKLADDLYQAVKTRLARRPAAAEALQDLEKTPREADTQAALRAQLKKALAEDEQFAARLEALVQQAQRDATQGNVTAAGRGVAAGRDINAPVNTGDVHGPLDLGAGKPSGGA